MNIPPHLIHAIESTHVAFETLSHPLRFIGAEPQGGGSVVITVETSFDGRPVRVSHPFSDQDLADERRVSKVLAEEVRSVFRREMKPKAP